MKFCFYKKHLEPPYYSALAEALPDRFTFASDQIKLPSKGTYIIINELSRDEYYIVRLKNKGKITTFDYRISCVDSKKIDFSIHDVSRLLKLKQGRFTDTGKISIIADEVKKAEKLKKYLIDKNPFLSDYFNEKQKHKDSELNDVVIEAQDAFSIAYEIFKVPAQYYQNLTESQILDWEINTLPDIMNITPDGKCFLEINDRRLYIQKVHNTPIEKCLGVDMVYNFYDEDRLIFVQYKCFNYENKKFYISRDKHLCSEIKKMSTLSGVCNNQHVVDNSQLRICDCPFFIKLCSRDIRAHREKPYGFYYTICAWQKITQRKPFITFDDEPRISNKLFTELIDSKLIGTRKGHAGEIQKHLLNSGRNDRLMLIFTEKKDRDVR